MSCAITEAQLLAVLKTQLGEQDPPITLKTTLFDLNMDSLDVIELAMAVEDACHCVVDEDALRERCDHHYREATVADLLEWLQPIKTTS